MAALELYSNYLESETKVSANTYQSYMRDIRIFGDYLHETNGRRNYEGVKKQTLCIYIDHLEKQGKAKSSIYRAMASLRSFYKYLLYAGLVDVNPAMEIDSPKVDRKAMREPLTSHETQTLLQQPVCSDYKGYRDKAMMELLCSTGIKISELIALDVEDVVIDDGYILCNVGGKKNKVSIGPMALFALKNYLSSARFSFLFEDCTCKALFLNTSGNRLTRQGLWKIIKTYTLKANIAKEISPHSLKKVSGNQKATAGIY